MHKQMGTPLSYLIGFEILKIPALDPFVVTDTSYGKTSIKSAKNRNRMRFSIHHKTLSCNPTFGFILCEKFADCSQEVSNAFGN
jgi:hypothetical protein